MLQLEDVHASYGSVHALRGVSLSVPSGAVVSLLGANGAGKSTILKTICNLMHARAGTVTFEGERIEHLKPEATVRRGIIMAPEGRQIFAELTVLENLKMGTYGLADRRHFAQDLEQVFNYFPILKTKADLPGGTLSGGQQQMLAIGRALMARPRLLLLDEPSLGLAPIIVQEIFEIIRRINATGTTILLVEQNANMALNVSDHAYVLETGVISVSGTAQALRNDDSVRRSYLGA